MCGSVEFRKTIRSRPSFTLRKMRRTRSCTRIPAHNRATLVKASSPGKVLSFGPAAQPDGEATPPRHGAADRPGADDDALPLGLRRSAPAPCWPGATVRGARASDRDAL